MSCARTCPAPEALEASNSIELEAWRLVGTSLAQHALGHEKESLQKDSAFEWLDRAYANRDPGMMRLKVDPLLRKLRGDPRYAALLRKMNLPADEGS